MKLSVEPDHTRPQLPFKVLLDAPANEVVVKIRAVGVSDPGFTLKLTRSMSSGPLSGTFWMEHSGDYEAVYADAQTVLKTPFRVEPQTYLAFPTEFGLFSLILGLVLTGVALWVKRIPKQPS